MIAGHVSQEPNDKRPPLEHLLSPLAVGHVRLRNRIVVTAHFTGFGGGPVPSKRDLAYLEARAAGGAGLLVTEGMVVHPTGLASEASWIATDPAVVPALRELAARAHRHGAAIFGQLRHLGRNMSGRYSRLPLWAPSPLPGSYYREIPHEIEAGEIQQVIHGFTTGARHVATAGLDGVELNAAHGFLLHGFLSPYTNRRTDGYGGSDENRLRLLAEVCQAIRATLGDRMVLGVRLSVEDFTRGGLNPEMVARIAASLAARRLLDYISLSQSNYETWSMGAMVPDVHAGQAPYAALARGVRAACAVPVVVAGGIRDPHVAEAVLMRGEADLVGMTRALIADPQLPERARSGPAGIRPCIACNACWDSLARGSPLRCAVNPSVGMEEQWRMDAPPDNPRRVIVAGGGVAGLEAARVAAERGHVVTLFERATHLGGQVVLAANAAGRGELAAIVPWLERAVRQAGVKLLLGQEATVAQIGQRGADVVIVATGARPMPAATFAIDRPVRDTWDYLRPGARVPHRAVIVDEDHGWEAPSVAEHLARQGSQVEMLTAQVTFGLDIPAISLPDALTRLKRLGVRLHTSVRPVNYARGELTMKDVHTGERSVVAGLDDLILAGCRHAETALLSALKAQRGPWHIAAVGDCQAPRDLEAAMWEGHVAGRRVGATGEGR